jgi:hypothetical protein
MNQITQTETQAVEKTEAETAREVTPQPKTTLIHTLLHAINEHIDRQVDAKVSAVLEAHSAVRYIDEAFKDSIQDIAENCVREHEESENHLTEDDVKAIMDDIITEQVRREVRDTDISDQIHDAITDYDFDDKFDAYDVDDKIEMYLDSNDFPDASRVEEMIIETVEEILEKKMVEVLKKLLEKMNGI